MSFKREGNDSSQLNILKKRRVADLLSNFIPEDEAALLKNGRYTCLVCSYRPVFDTVDMLTVHRKSKKHLEGMKWYYGHKKQLQNEIAKRQHQDYVLAEDSRQEASSSAPLLTQTRKITHHALLKTVPYSSCHKKTSTKPERGSANSDSDIKTRPSSTATSPQHQTIDQQSINAAYSTPTVNQGSCPSGKKNESKTSESTVSHESEHLTPQRRRELEHYLKLKSAGWLQDSSGQWVKDENVEFDSDEDEPTPVPSSPGDSTNNRPEDPMGKSHWRENP